MTTKLTASELITTYIQLATIKKYAWPIQLAVKLAIIRTRLEVDASVVLGHLQAIEEKLQSDVTEALARKLQVQRAVLYTMTFTTTVLDEYGGPVPLSSLPIDFLADLRDPNVASSIEWLFPGVTDVCRQIAAQYESGTRGSGPAESVQEG